MVFIDLSSRVKVSLGWRAIGLFHGVDGMDAADSLQDLHHNVQDVRPLYI